MPSPIDILVGTTAGNTEFLAAELEQKLHSLGHKTQFHDYPKWADIDFKQSLLLCIATHGAGEYAESIAEFMEQLEKKQPDLSHLKYALVAIGDSSYDTYCSAGIEANKLMQTLGAKELFPFLQIDMQLNDQPEITALDWLKNISWP